eukprot:9006824-Pyramimonas_sp.AAC.1
MREYQEVPIYWNSLGERIYLRNWKRALKGSEWCTSYPLWAKHSLRNNARSSPRWLIMDLSNIVAVKTQYVLH